MRAKKHLGQNFLKSTAIVHDIVTAAEITNNDTVLEIGPGKGVLTRALLETGARVIAIEKDPELLPLLKETFDDFITSGQLLLIEQDILEANIDTLPISSGYKLVANIPYYITGEIIRLFLSEYTQPISITLMVQKEVAERIVARDEKESILSLSVKVYGTPHYIKKVPARYFSPAPKIDSAIIHIGTISRNNLLDIGDAKFFTLIKTAFAHKRKRLANNLKGVVTKEQLEMCTIDENSRAENIKLEQWLCLCKNNFPNKS